MPAFPTAPPDPEPVRSLHLPTPQSITLANGLRVIAVPHRHLPLISARLLVAAGSATDPVGKAGLAALTSTLLSRGAGPLDAPAQALAAETLGGSLLTSAGRDAVLVGISVIRPHIRAALDLVAASVRAPTLAADELTRARAQVLDDLRLQRSQPGPMAALLARQKIFADGAYAHPVDGTEHSLATITRADLLHQHARWYRPDNAVLVLAGDLDLDRAQDLATAAFGDWPTPDTPLPTPAAGAGAAPTGASVQVLDQPGSGQAAVIAAHRSSARAAPDHLIGGVANAVLGGTYSARLNAEIRIRHGLSYGAHSHLEGAREGGLWLASVQTANASAATVLRLLREQFRRLRDEPVSTTELATRKATLIGAYGRSLETIDGLADRIATLALHGLPLDTLGHYIEDVQAVTPAQVQAYARQHLAAAELHIVVAGDAAQFLDPLRQAEPGLQRIDATTLG